MDAPDEDSVGTYRILQKELENYPSGPLASSIGQEVIGISGKHSIGLEKLVAKLKELVLAETAEQAKKNQKMEERSY